MRSTTVERLYVGATSVVLLVVAFLSFTQPVQTARPAEQEDLYVQVPTVLDPQGKPPVAAPAKGPGSALAYMQVPRFGKDWLWTIVEGTAEEDLAEGPGHYTGTALMGAVGNFAVAGHRAGHGDPFIDFDLLRVGDEVTVRQSGGWWTYRIFRGPQIITSDTMWILNQPPRRRIMTLTTCWPKYGDAKRMFVRGELVDWSGK